MKTYLIVGGGTAGWMTALYCKKIFPNENIILVENNKIGILGAGETGTPNVVSILNFLEISVEDMIKNTGATIKNALKFVNWDSEKDYFYHPFVSKSLLSEQPRNFYLRKYYENSIDFSSIIANIKNESYHDYVFIDKISEKNLIPFELEILDTGFTSKNIFDNFCQVSNWSINFDATKLADFFKKIGISRNIVLKEGFVNEIQTDQNGFINSIKINDEIVKCDFVFDCTGFARKFIGNFYNSEWKSFKNSLPANRAMPFFLKNDKKIPSYGQAIAMNYGWMWKVPLQHRYGCGYVYSDQFISDDKIKKEIELSLGQEIEIPKMFSFEAGCYKKIWIKNCLSVGLSSGFVEPLEATSLMQSIFTLRKFFSDKLNIETKNKYIIDNFNKKYLNDTQEIIDFIYFHYVTNKKEEFWKNFTKNTDMPDFVKYIFEVYKDRPISDEIDFYNREIFGSENYNYVLNGHKFINKNVLNKYLKNFDIESKINQYEIMRRNQEISYLRCINHEWFLSLFK